MLILWFGSNNVILQAGLTFEVIIIFHQYIDRLFNPIQQLAEQFNILQSAFAASEKSLRFWINNRKSLMLPTPSN